MVMAKQAATKNLNKELATANAIRNPWGAGTVAAGLTPGRLSSILRGAAENDADDYLTLAEEMEERDAHYSSVLRTRKLAVSRLDLTVRAASDDKKDQDLADEIRAITKTPAYQEMMDDALDAIGKGYSVTEIIWSKGAKWTPENFIHRDPRFFMFHPDDPGEIRLKSETNQVNGQELEPFKFIVHRPRLKTGIALRGGLARLVAWSYLFKQYAVKDWIAFLEIYGVPLRLGKYGNSATDEQIDTLKTAVSNIGSDAAAVLPESMQIEFQQVAQASGGSDVFKSMAEWLDRQVSKAVLGQTMTSDDGSSQAQASVHNEVRKDLIDADAQQLTNTLNRDLVRPFIDLNYGTQDEYPTIHLSAPEQADMALLSDSLAKLVPLGLRVDSAEILAKLGLEMPGDDAVLLGQAIQGDDAAQNRVSGCHHCGTDTAINKESQDDPILNDMMEDWAVGLAPIMDPIMEQVEGAKDFDDLKKRLAKINDSVNLDELAESLASAGLVAYAQGVSGKG
jgi:phage gp29-like protein